MNFLATNSDLFGLGVKKGDEKSVWSEESNLILRNINYPLKSSLK
jgi:hypothetical protein